MKRQAVLCPGRGSYTKKSLRSLPADHAWVQRAEELRQEYGLGSLLELDGAKRFNADEHLRPDNVSPLIYMVTMLDAAEAMAKHETVCVAGNSMGWYSALAVAGSLSFDDGFRLVQEMALLQMEHTDGGQILYPQVGDQWRPDHKLIQRMQEAVAATDGAYLSILLGGYAVLAGSEAGLAALQKALPPVEMGPSLFPFRLKGHGPYHTPLLAGVATKAAAQLGRLQFSSPRVTLIDGRGARFAPQTTDPNELAAYTLGAQIIRTFDFTASVRTALREFAPDLLTLPGPGNSLGGVCGQIVIGEKWRGIDSRDAFEAQQRDDAAVIWSMRRL